MTRWIATLLLVLTLAACRSAGAPAPRVASLSEEIQLAPSEQVVFGQSLNVQFIRVVEDSRCPSDVTCVWAGEVKIEVSTRIDDAAAERHEVTSSEPATVGAFRIVVVQVQPEKISTRPIAPEEYRVTLKVQPASG